MKKAVFEFKCPLNIIELNNFFRHKNILLSYDNINQKLNEFRFQISSVFLKAINPYLIKQIKVNITGKDDHIYFYSVPLPYVKSGDQFVIAGKVPYMATPVVAQLDVVSTQYELKLVDADHAVHFDSND